MAKMQTIDLDDVIAKPLTLDDALSSLDAAAVETIAAIQSTPGFRSSTAVRHADLVALEVGISDLRGAISRHAA